MTCLALIPLKWQKLQQICGEPTSKEFFKGLPLKKLQANQTYGFIWSNLSQKPRARSNLVDKQAGNFTGNLRVKNPQNRNEIKKIKLIIFLLFEMSANSNGSHLGSKIISAQVSKEKILGDFFLSKCYISINHLKEKFHWKIQNIC